MTLHLRAWGRGVPLACLHGLTDCGLEFRALAERLEGRRVLAPDLRGHGASDWAPPWRLEQLLEDVLAAVGEEPRDWLGHSLGGRLCLELAHARPELVERLVLLDPAIRFPAAHAFELAERERTGPADQWASQQPGRERRPYCRAAAVALFGEIARPAPPFPRVPTVLVLPEEGSVVGPNRRRAYAETLGPLLETVVVPGGHAVHWEALEQTVDAIERFLRRSPGP